MVFEEDSPTPSRMKKQRTTETIQVEATRMSDIASMFERSKGSCVRLMVSGSVSHCGKTTACLSILGAALNAGLTPEEIAYIKPATQCEAPDLLAAWTARHGIVNVSGKDAPLVFFPGFTRSFLNGEQGTSEQIQSRIATEIDRLSACRRLVLIDGVGFPSVGSVCGVDNVDVAIAASAPVILIGKSGVGGAIDSFNLNAAYFAQRGVRVLGTVLNFADPVGFSSHTEVDKYFNLYLSNNHRSERLYGVVPLCDELNGFREKISENDESSLEKMAVLNINHFTRSVDFGAMISDAAGFARLLAPASTVPVSSSNETASACPKRSRADIEEAARTKGAEKGG